MRALVNITFISYTSLIIGILVGFFAQRSRMCFIGGWRDFFIIRDTYLLKGFFSFLITAAVLFFIFSQGHYLKDYPWFNRPPLSFAPIELNPFETVLPDQYRNMSYCELLMSPLVLTVGEEIPIRGVTIFSITIPNELLLTLFAALFLGFFSTLANGCPMRQHVLASSGDVTSIVYLLGFYAAIVVYDKFIVGFMNELVNVF